MTSPTMPPAGPAPEVWAWLPRERDRALAPAAGEVLYEAHGLARRLGAGLVAVSDEAPEADEAALLGRWGVERVRALGAPLPPHPPCPQGRSPLEALLADARPRVALFAADSFGRVAAPLFAAACGATFVPGATSATTDGRGFVIARPTLGEQYEALVYAPLDTPLVVTLLPGAVGEAQPEAPGGTAPEAPGGTAPELALPTAPLRVPSAPPELRPPDPDTVDIADAERIVAFGRGAFNGEAVALVERLARALGATVAGTRPAADEGWLPFARQVGLTGAIVRPRLYVAVGISGAPYHMVGIKDPETLVAINSDAEAPIFGAAHLGIVGDLYEVLPALLERLERGEGLPGAGGAEAP